MKKKLSQLFLKSFAIAAGLTAGIVGVSLVAITVSPWAQPRTNWVSGESLGVLELNDIGNNLAALNTAMTGMNNLANSPNLDNCGAGDVPTYDNNDGSWNCQPGGGAQVLPKILEEGSLPYNIQGTDDTVINASPTAASSIYLPDINNIPSGTRFYIQHSGNSAMYLTIQPATSQTINSFASCDMDRGGYIELISPSSGTDWSMKKTFSVTCI